MTVATVTFVLYVYCCHDDSESTLVAMDSKIVNIPYDEHHDQHGNTQ